MNGLESLATLLEHAERQRDEALSAAQRASAQMAAAAEQAQQLLVYRRDYETRWTEQFGRQGTMEIVNCYQGFVKRLGLAIEHQDQMAAQARHQHDQARARLRDQEIRVASIAKLIERRVAEARIAEGKRDQKATDEMAARLAWARLNDTSGFGAASA